MDTDDGFEVTAPVGHYPPNAFGLLDTIGNVGEWCEDRFAPYPSSAVTDPTGATTGDSRVLRGGSWAFRPSYCRAAYRFRLAPDHRSGSFGVRLASSRGLAGASRH